MSEHTPGPWRDYEVDAFGDHAITQDDGGLAIAVVVTNFREEGEVAANARLIAAAPELLEAARNLELWYRAGGCRHTSPDELMKNLMAVIAKSQRS